MRIAIIGSLAFVTGLSAQRPALPRVVVLATGGTIASRVDPNTGALAPALTGADLVRAVPGLDTIARVEAEQIANVGSYDMTPEIWRRLSARANELLADPSITGVVVTHGTDTLEETAYFLDLTITSTKPVVVVGAQRAASFFDSDGPRNLLNAVRVVTSPEALGKGVLVVMNGQINAAREVTKTNTIEAETFKSLEFGALGVADLGAVRFYRAPLRRQTIPLSAAQPLGRVEIVSQYAGADGRVIRLLLQESGLDGLVVEGFGLGHVTAGTLDAIRQARARQIPVVLGTRVYTGRLIPLYARDAEASALGVIRADNLSAQKARVLLLLALTRTKDVTELQKIFDR
ncbi:MAG: asparaginase [Longimicrobiales bacterium]